MRAELNRMVRTELLFFAFCACVVFWKAVFGFDMRAVSWHRRSMVTGVNVVLGLYIMETLSGLGSGREEVQDTLILIMISFLSKEGPVRLPRICSNYSGTRKGRA
jgi:hypothetical protein